MVLTEIKAADGSLSLAPEIGQLSNVEEDENCSEDLEKKR
jgi:hypothetical protein